MRRFVLFCAWSAAMIALGFVSAGRIPRRDHKQLPPIDFSAETTIHRMDTANPESQKEKKLLRPYLLILDGRPLPVPNESPPEDQSQAWQIGFDRGRLIVCLTVAKP